MQHRLAMEPDDVDFRRRFPCRLQKTRDGLDVAGCQFPFGCGEAAGPRFSVAKIHCRCDCLHEQLTAGSVISITRSGDAPQCQFAIGLDKEGIAEDTPEFVRNRVAMQDAYMEEIWSSFPDVRGLVPLFETEVRGVEMLERTANHLFRGPHGNP